MSGTNCAAKIYFAGVQKIVRVTRTRSSKRRTPKARVTTTTTRASRFTIIVALEGLYRRSTNRNVLAQQSELRCLSGMAIVFI